MDFGQVRTVKLSERIILARFVACLTWQILNFGHVRTDAVSVRTTSDVPKLILGGFGHVQADGVLKNKKCRTDGGKSFDMFGRTRRCFRTPSDGVRTDGRAFGRPFSDGQSDQLRTVLSDCHYAKITGGHQAHQSSSLKQTITRAIQTTSKRCNVPAINSTSATFTPESVDSKKQHKNPTTKIYANTKT